MSTETLPDEELHPTWVLAQNPDLGWACQTRLPFKLTCFDRKCRECKSAAIGYADAGQLTPHFGVSRGGVNHGQRSLEEWLQDAAPSPSPGEMK